MFTEFYPSLKVLLYAHRNTSIFEKEWVKKKVKGMRITEIEKLASIIFLDIIIETQSRLQKKLRKLPNINRLVQTLY